MASDEERDRLRGELGTAEALLDIRRRERDEARRQRDELLEAIEAVQLGHLEDIGLDAAMAALYDTAKRINGAVGASSRGDGLDGRSTPGRATTANTSAGAGRLPARDG